MDRLTNDTNMLDITTDDTFAFLCYLKLKKYEDTGLSPDEIISLKKQNNIRGKLIKSLNISVPSAEELQRVYFTFGSADNYPYHNGWVVIEAPSYDIAIEIFQKLYPNPISDFVNCAGIYKEDVFKTMLMYKNGNFGHFCHASYIVKGKEVLQDG